MTISHHRNAPHFDKILSDSFKLFADTAGDILSDDRLNRLLLTDSKPVEVLSNCTQCKWIIEAVATPTAGKYWVREYLLKVSIPCDDCDLLDQVQTYQLVHDLSNDKLSYRHQTTQFICYDNDGEPTYIESWYANDSALFHTIQLVPF